MRKIACAMVVLLMVASGMVFAGCDSSDPKNFHVGFVYAGPVGTEGLAYAHDQARQAMETSLGVTTHFLENVPANEETSNQIERLIKRMRCKVVVLCSAEFEQFAVEMAEKYPEVTFLQHEGTETRANLATYAARMYQGEYLAGIAAGYATKTDKLGYVAAQRNPASLADINAFAMGARSVNPDATVSVVWSGAWRDAVLEDVQANALLSAGCDVIAQRQDTSAAVAAAEKVSAAAVGYGSTMAGKAPQHYLTGPVWDFSAYLTPTVEKIFKGEYSAASYFGGMDTGMVKLDSFGPGVADQAKAAIAQREAAMKAGEDEIFAGPLRTHDGQAYIDAGEKLTDEQIQSMDWLVEGVLSGGN